ncbi:hypothetical protein GT347_24890 [Xylophilus rhododendri]|uniref:Uncharacterized protein n=1 Tax=Xylophilus rhododendri TaxID=2697032 RepID=A0A857JCW0_9BURK|nr:hypothetical protein [Xylophilus rhododendri]QHJ00940.1 hypothetical protein GT347_24890 [Xylophilus rhododendri]
MIDLETFLLSDGAFFLDGGIFFPHHTDGGKARCIFRNLRSFKYRHLNRGAHLLLVTTEGREELQGGRDYLTYTFAEPYSGPLMLSIRDRSQISSVKDFDADEARRPES